MIAHARYLSSSSSSTSSMGEYRSFKVERWIEAMNKVVDVEQEKKHSFAPGGNNTLEGEAANAPRDGICCPSVSNGHAHMEKNEMGMMVGTKMKH